MDDEIIACRAYGHVWPGIPGQRVWQGERQACERCGLIRERVEGRVVYQLPGPDYLLVRTEVLDIDPLRISYAVFPDPLVMVAEFDGQAWTAVSASRDGAPVEIPACFELDPDIVELLTAKATEACAQMEAYLREQVEATRAAIRAVVSES